MSYLEHAKREFKAAGWDLEKDKMQKMMCSQVIELLNLFSKHGHSGSSAPYAINLFTTLAKFEPIVPLTGEDSEWNYCGHGDRPLWQNNRCSRVFKDSDGKAYDIDGIVFEDEDGCCYTSKESRVYVEFPYMPKTIYKKAKDKT